MSNVAGRGGSDRLTCEPDARLPSVDPTPAVGSSTERYVILTVALASMLSKYLRELHMLVFNRYWNSYEEKLKPTAGYVLDARRFLADTADLRNRLETDPGLLIRSR